MSNHIDDLLEIGRKPAVAAEYRGLGGENKFPALWAIAGILKVIAVLSLLLSGFVWLLVLVHVGKVGLSRDEGWLLFSLILWTVLGPLSTWGYAEIILVFLQIEKNTAETNRLLASGIGHVLRSVSDKR